jgi:hypothetical protein
VIDLLLLVALRSLQAGERREDAATHAGWALTSPAPASTRLA